MASFQWIAGEFGVREGPYPKLGRVVADVALALRFAQAELPAMRIFMAPATPPGRTPVAGSAACPSVLFSWSVTAATSSGSMRPRERPGLVLDIGRVPTDRPVACSAAVLLHFLGKLITVRILVAGRARRIADVPVEAFLLPGRGRVAHSARDSVVATRQWEGGRRMQGDPERAGPKPAHLVARPTFASLARLEAAVVGVRMTVATRIEVELSKSRVGFLLRRVTGVTRHRLVAPLQRKRCPVVSGQPYLALLPEPADVAVARVTLLAEVRFMDGSMAVHTSASARRAHERAPVVTGATLHSGVSIREAQLTMRAGAQGNAVPVLLGVATLARAGKSPLVRVVVAVGAGSEFEASVARRLAVACVAVRLLVATPQREASLGMIEGFERDLLPRALAVAAGALLAESALVRVLVAGGTFLPETHVAPLLVTLVAGHLRVGSTQRPPRLGVVQALRVPPNQSESATMVVRVTTRAGLPLEFAPMQPAARRLRRGNTLMAAGALRIGDATPGSVAATALRIPLELRMGG